MAEPKHKQTGKSSWTDEPFRIESTTKTEAPDGSGQDNWYRYVIVQGKNSITGYRQGSLESVTEAIEEIATRLNERRMGKAGRVQLTPGPKKKG